MPTPEMYLSCTGIGTLNVFTRPRKKYCLFPVTVRNYFFWPKMCVLCMFNVDLELDGRKKNLKGRDFFGIKTCYGRGTGNKQLFF